MPSLEGVMSSGFLPSRKLAILACMVLLGLCVFLLAGRVSQTSMQPARMSQDMINQQLLQHHLQEQQQQQQQHQRQREQQQKEQHEEESQPVEEQVFKDKVDNSKGLELLLEYNKVFNRNRTLTADPNSPSTITKWWQAAAMIDWYTRSTVRHRCDIKIAFGNWHVCQDSPYTVKPPCLVYSFGIAFDYSFDDAMGKIGCEVHSFDPSMNVEDHKRNANVTFHNMGLGSTNSNVFNPRKDIYVKDTELKWKMRTLKSTMAELGHADRVLDVLKIDIEGHEWAVLNNLIETNMFPVIRQFMLEFHLFPDWPAKEDYVDLYRLYTRLREMGLREFSTAPHPRSLSLKRYNVQGDSEYINAFFQRKNKPSR